jgi:hypothetical protein
MRHPSKWLVTCLATVITLSAFPGGHLLADEPDSKAVQSAIAAAKGALLNAQQADGSWSDKTSGTTYQIGSTSLTLLALMQSGMTRDDPEIERGVNWLRQQEPNQTKEISLMIQALVAAGDIRHDLPQVTRLAGQLEDWQVRDGPNAGSWTYSNRVRPVGLADRCNSYFAIVGLNDATNIGVPVSTATWRKARAHWLSMQNDDGSWWYKGAKQAAGGTGSMTSAGIAALIITHDRVQKAGDEANAGKQAEPDTVSIEQPLEDAFHWMGTHFAVNFNPGDGRWVLFYLDTLAQVGRLSGRKLLTGRDGAKHDWYDAGSTYLIQTQNQFTGTWKDFDARAGIGTSFALHFLSMDLKLPAK